MYVFSDQPVAFFLVMRNAVITTAATVETAMTTMTTAPIMTPITHPDMRIAAAVSSIGEVGAEGS